MRTWTKFWYYFLFGGPSPALLGAFTLGLLVINMLGDLAYDVLTAQASKGIDVWVPLATASVLLVMQDSAAVRKTFARFSEELLDQGLPTQVHLVYIRELSAQAAYQAVTTIFTRECAEQGLPPSAVIADITSGTKPMTAGMVLAALTRQRPLEYVESDRDADGFPIAGSLRVVLANTDFYVTREGVV